MPTKLAERRKARRVKKRVHAQRRVPNPARIDPTRTLTLRNAFRLALRKRFAKLKKAIRHLLIVEDAFALKRKNQLVTHTIFKFHTTSEQVEGFRKWLSSQMKYQIVGTMQEEIKNAWFKQYIIEGYQKGAGRSFDDLKKPALADSEKKLNFYNGTKSEFLKSSFAQPVAQDKVELLAGRVFTELEGVTDSMAQQMTRALTDGLVEGKSPYDIADDLVERANVGESRAETIARTEIIRAHAEGQLDALQSMGVEEVGVMVEWSTAGFDVCEECEPMEDVVLQIDEARGQIPMHPNAVFAGSTFVPYGECEEIVRAWYCGPSVVLTLRSGLDGTTIGPNHPIMTRRGMVPAAQLREGDEVLYDHRKNWPSVSSDVKQVPVIEDVFDSLLKITGDAGIVTTTSDLHGDRVFCKGEVQAIRPANGLLTVWNSFGVEKLRELDFAGTNTQLEFRPGVGPSLTSRQRVFLASSSRVGKGSQLRVGVNSPLNIHPSQSAVDSLSIDSKPFGERAHAFPAQVSLPDFFQWERIHKVSSGWYEGLAFDATTATSLYYSGGLVVSNCRCCWIPANVGEDEEDQKRDKEDIDDAIEESTEAGGDFDSEISEDRPESILNRLYNLVVHGGQGSGNFGHAGRQGEVGGSGPGGGRTDFPIDPSSTSHVKALGGSTGATLVQDLAGNKFVRKTGSSEAQLRAEFAAEQAYRAAGVRVPDSKLYETSGGPVKLSRFIEGGKEFNQLSEQQKQEVLPQIQKGFAVDAALANWDVGGLKMDNILVKDGRAYRIDVGGSLDFRAQGGPKGAAWGEHVGELESMRNPTKNPSAAKLFGGMSQDEIQSSAIHLLDHRAAFVKALPEKYHAKINARLNSIESQTGSKGLVKEEKPVTAPKPVLAGYGGHQQTGHDLHYHIAYSNSPVKFTSLQLKKIAIVNPKGTTTGVVKIPQALSDKHIAHLQKILPEGTQLKKVSLSYINKDTPSHLSQSEAKAAKAGKSSKPQSSEVKPTDPWKSYGQKPTEPIGKAVHVREMEKLGAAGDGPGVQSGLSVKLTSSGKLDHVAIQQGTAKTTYEERAAISAWTNGKYREMRISVNKGEPTEQAKTFMNGIEKLPPFKGTTYRGLRVDSDDNNYGAKQLRAIAATGVGGIWKDKAPMSTSTSIKEGLRFASGGLLLKITGKTGRPIAHLSQFKNEKEIVGRAGVEYRIKSIVKNVEVTNKIPHSYHSKSIKMLVHLEEI